MSSSISVPSNKPIALPVNAHVHPGRLSKMNQKPQKKAKPVVVADKFESASLIKKQMRDTSRLLKKQGLTATIKQSLERRVESLQTSLIQRSQLKKESKLAQKYKYIKFVEAKKVNRKLAQLVREPNPELSRLYQTYSDYIEYFPIDLKYISLFPGETTQVNLNEMQVRVMALIADAKSNGTLKVGSLKYYQNDDKESVEEEEEEQSQEQDEFFA